MKPTRLADVLDDKVVDKTFWDGVFNKMELLYRAIEMFKGSSMSIDDTEYRWVKNRIEYWDNESRILTKTEMQLANRMWGKYGK